MYYESGLIRHLRHNNLKAPMIDVAFKSNESKESVASDWNRFDVSISEYGDRVDWKRVCDGGAHRYTQNMDIILRVKIYRCCSPWGQFLIVGTDERKQSTV